MLESLQKVLPEGLSTLKPEQQMPGVIILILGLQAIKAIFKISQSLEHHQDTLMWRMVELIVCCLSLFSATLLLINSFIEERDRFSAKLKSVLLSIPVMMIALSSGAGTSSNESIYMHTSISFLIWMYIKVPGERVLATTAGSFAGGKFLIYNFIEYGVSLESMVLSAAIMAMGCSAFSSYQIGSEFGRREWYERPLNRASIETSRPPGTLVLAYQPPSSRFKQRVKKKLSRAVRQLELCYWLPGEAAPPQKEASKPSPSRSPLQPWKAGSMEKFITCLPYPALLVRRAFQKQDVPDDQGGEHFSAEGASVEIVVYEDNKKQLPGFQEMSLNEFIRMRRFLVYSGVSVPSQQHHSAMKKETAQLHHFQSIVDLIQESKESQLVYLQLHPDDGVAGVHLVQVEIIHLEPDHYLVKLSSKVNSLLERQSRDMQHHYQAALTATISHEQMNPLNSIINFSRVVYQLVKELSEMGDGHDVESKSSNSVMSRWQKLNMSQGTHGPNNLLEIPKEDLQQCLDLMHIVHCSSMELKLLNSAMMNVTLIQSGKLELQMQHWSKPIEFLKHYCRIFETQMKQNRISFFIEDRISGDAHANLLFSTQGAEFDLFVYKQILYNIIINACKFSKVEGQIKISLELKDRARCPDSNTILLTTEIQDSGVGMSQERLDKLCKLFENVHTSIVDSPGNDSTRTSGQGLGLYLSNQLVRFLGGELIVNSREGEGTSVRVSFPIRLAEGKRQYQSATEDSLDESPTSKKMVKSQPKPKPRKSQPRIGRRRESSNSYHRLLPIGFKQEQQRTRGSVSVVQNSREFEKITMMFKSHAQMRQSPNFQKKSTFHKQEANLRDKDFRRPSNNSNTTDSFSFHDKNHPKVDTQTESQLQFTIEEEQPKPASVFNKTFEGYQFGAMTTNPMNTISTPEEEAELPVIKETVPDHMKKSSQMSLSLILEGEGAEEESNVAEVSQNASKTPIFNRNYSIQQACLDSSTNTYFAEDAQNSQPEIPNISPIANHSQISIGNTNKDVFTFPELRRLPEEEEVKSANSSISENVEEQNAVLSNSFSSIANVPSAQVDKYCISPHVSATNLVRLATDLTDFNRESDSFSRQQRHMTFTSHTNPNLLTLPAPSSAFNNGSSAMPIPTKIETFGSYQFNIENLERGGGPSDHQSFKGEQNLSRSLFSRGSRKSSLADEYAHRLHRPSIDSVYKPLGASAFSFGGASPCMIPGMNTSLAPSRRQRSGELRKHSVCDQVKYQLCFSPSKLRKNSIDPSFKKRRLSQFKLSTTCKCQKSPILVVDDNIFNIETIKVMIHSKFGIQPDIAMNGQEAVDAFKKKNQITAETVQKQLEECSFNCPKKFYRLIFMDLNMPVLDGFEATKQILEFQALPAQCHLPKCQIAALTAFTDDSNIQRCKEYGMIDILHKPASNKDIVALINKQCPFFEQQ